MKLWIERIVFILVMVSACARVNPVSIYVENHLPQPSSHIAVRVSEFMIRTRRPTPSFGGVDLGFDFGPQSQGDLVKRSDVRVMSSEVLSEEMTIIGVPRLTGRVRARGCHPDLAVTLVDIYPSGEPFLFTEGIKRFSAEDSRVEVQLWTTA